MWYLHCHGDAVRVEDAVLDEKVEGESERLPLNNVKSCYDGPHLFCWFTVMGHACPRNPSRIALKMS